MKKGFLRVVAVFMTVFIIAGVFYGCDNSGNDDENVVTDPEGMSYLAIAGSDGKTYAGVTDAGGKLYAASIDDKGNVLKDGDLYEVTDYDGTLPTNDTTAVSVNDTRDDYNYADAPVVTDENASTSKVSVPDSTKPDSQNNTDNTNSTTSANGTTNPGGTTGSGTTANSGGTTGSSGTTQSGGTTGSNGTTNSQSTTKTNITTKVNGTTSTGSTTKRNDTTTTTSSSSSELLAEKYKKLFSSGTYYIEFSSDEMEDPVTAAVKNGNIYMKTKLEGMSCTMIYQKNKDNLYVVLNDYRVYCKMPPDMLDELDMSQFGSTNEVKDVTVYNVTIGDRVCRCESYELDSGGTSTYYFYKDTLVRMDQINEDGSTSVMNITKVSSSVDDSLFELPKGFIPFNLSKLDLDGFDDETTASSNK